MWGEAGTQVRILDLAEARTDHSPPQATSSACPLLPPAHEDSGALGWVILGLPWAPVAEAGINLPASRDVLESSPTPLPPTLVY